MAKVLITYKVTTINTKFKLMSKETHILHLFRRIFMQGTYL